MSINKRKRLQRHLKLEADGVIGPATLSTVESIVLGKQDANKDKKLYSLP
ncbi:MAG: lysozyme family protein [Cellvibrionaceae bacterium]|jgi:lysozyme family protein